MSVIQSWIRPWVRSFIRSPLGDVGTRDDPAKLFEEITGVSPSGLWTNGLADRVGSNDLVVVGTPGVAQPVVDLVASSLTRSAFTFVSSDASRLEIPAPFGQLVPGATQRMFVMLLRFTGSLLANPTWALFGNREDFGSFIGWFVSVDTLGRVGAFVRDDLGVSVTAAVTINHSVGWHVFVCGVRSTAPEWHICSELGNSVFAAGPGDTTSLADWIMGGRFFPMAPVEIAFVADLQGAAIGGRDPAVIAQDVHDALVL